MNAYFNSNLSHSLLLLSFHVYFGLFFWQKEFLNTEKSIGSIPLCVEPWSAVVGFWAEPEAWNRSTWYGASSIRISYAIRNEREPTKCFVYEQSVLPLLQNFLYGQTTVRRNSNSHFQQFDRSEINILDLYYTQFSYFSSLNEYLKTYDLIR